MARYSILGSYLMDITELQQVEPYTLLRLKKPQRDLYNLSVITGLWAETDYLPYQGKTH